MKIKLSDLTFKNSKGIYCITNLITNQKYIGSVTKSKFKLRFKQHYNALIKGKHENQHLQRSFNKYGEKSFMFEILHIMEEFIFEKEDWYLKNTDNLYNKHLNAFAPLNRKLTEEQIQKQVDSNKKNHKEAMFYYNKLKNKEIELKDIPQIYLPKINSYLCKKTWNKGLTKENYDYSFLKGVPKNKTEKYIQSRIDFSKNQRLKSKKIFIFDYLGNFIKSFDSASDIVDYTKKEHDLPLILRNHKNRKSKSGEIPFYILEINNILKVLLGKQSHHKGLIFRYFDSEIPVVPLKSTDIYWNVKSFESLFFYNHKLHQ